MPPAMGVRSMGVDLEKMLERCERGQWRVDDFDWSQPPLRLDEARERAVCQYYVDMSYIERLAGALFLALSKRLDDPTLAAIFRTFHADELRHSHAAARLADYFDVHHFQVYTPNVAMLRFIPYFIGAIETLNPAFATSLILGGELILDIALLRGLNDYVDDPLSRAVVERINQDESRHLAMDMHMTEYFARHDLSRDGAANPWLGRDFWGILQWGPAFFADVFFRPMAILDPSQDQMREVMRRFRRFYDRDAVAANPAVQQFQGFVAFFESTGGAALGDLLTRVFRWGFDVDLDFVRAGSATRVYGGARPSSTLVAAAS